MRTLALLGLAFLALATAALGTPLIAAGLGALGFDFSFGRTWNRVFQFGFAIFVALAWRRLDLGTARQLGLARAGWSRELLLGLGVGLVGIGAGILAGWLFRGVVPDLRFDDWGKTATKALSGFGAAVLLGFGEELLFRGVLLRRLMADMGRWAGLLTTTAIYAVVHALRPGHDAGGHAAAGIERALGLFAPLAQSRPWPAIAGLFAFGCVLAYARLRTGSLWVPIGIHAAWVAMFRVGRLFVQIRPWPKWVVGPGWPPLVGGAAGAVAIVVTFAALLVALRRWRAGRGG